MQKLDYSVYVIQFYKKAQSMQKLRVTAVSLAPGCSRGQTMPFNNNNNNNKVNLYTAPKSKKSLGAVGRNSVQHVIIIIIPALSTFFPFAAELYAPPPTSFSRLPDKSFMPIECATESNVAMC